MTYEEKQELLLEKLAEAWEVTVDDLPAEVQQSGTHRGTCPACGNGKGGNDLGFAVTVEEDTIVWCCHRATCGYRGGVSVRGGARADSSDVEAALGAVTAAARQGPGLGPLRDAGSAAVIRDEQHKVQQAKAAPPPINAELLQPLSQDFKQWFKQRGISEQTLARNGVRMQQRYCAAERREMPHIAFPYFRNGGCVNVKFRALPKHFSQTKGGEQIFYGYDDAKGADDIIIVEGEMDKLAVDEALLQMQQQQQQQQQPDGAASVALTADNQWLLNGRRVAVLSVPAGAPAITAKDAKFKYVHACSDVLDACERVILAGDSDGPGVLLADELARRIDREKCWRVSWPSGPQDSLDPGAAAAAFAAAAGSSSNAPGQSMQLAGGQDAAAVGPEPAQGFARKDANEVLMKDGAALLVAYLEAAQPLPIRGLFTFMDFWPQVYDLYQQGPRGLSWGVSTGWDSLDACYKVVPGELTIVTGLPNSGKSEWIDALAVNLARREGWRIALCSMENSAKEHGRKLMEKYIGKPFFSAVYSHGSARMDMQELVDALVWIDTQFHIIRPMPDTQPTIEYILDKARAAVMRYGIRGLVIDPYNELDHRRSAAFSETEHVSRMLTKIKRFAQHYDCHVWFVAHPRTQRGFSTGGGSATLTPPTMYDISGSANFINKADNGIVVHRPWSTGQDGGLDPAAVQLLVRKVRNKLAGKIGDVTLRYDRATGCYVDDLVQPQSSRQL
ncbi:hypothetical protein OEZ86_011950 [Tetradesmus obliquus]|nr:hypothetical protein OEZ86_011950 [Tetradesmus obliquus]